MYRQLDEAPLERLEPFGRVRDTKHKPREGVLQLVGRDITTGGLARYSAHTPIWSMWTGPDEFAHWVLHTRQSTPYQAATSPDGQRRVVWTGGTDADCPNPWAWHVTQAKPSPYIMQEPSPQWIEEHRAERCILDLGAGSKPANR